MRNDEDIYINYAISYHMYYFNLAFKMEPCLMLVRRSIHLMPKYQLFNHMRILILFTVERSR